MKHRIMDKSYYLVLVYALVSLFACSDMNDLHDKYLRKGETIYVGRPDSVKVFSGRDRVLMRYWSSDPKAKKMMVYWQLRSDSILVSIPTRDSVDLLINNLPESSYNFELVTMKEDLTCRSIPFQINANTYGKRYQSSINFHLIKSAKLISSKDIAIEWYPPNDNEIGNEIVYRNTDGLEVSKIVSQDEVVTKFFDYGKDLKYRTLYLPTPTAIDTFYTDYQFVQLKEPTCGELIGGFKRWNPSEIPYKVYGSYHVENLWDNNINSFYLVAAGQLPYSFTFDLGKNIKLERIKLFQRQNLLYNSQNVKKFQLWGSDSPSVSADFSEWSKLGDFEITKPSGLPAGENSPEDIAVAAEGHEFYVDPTQQPVRYIRVVVESAWSGATIAVAEIKFFGWYF